MNPTRDDTYQRERDRAVEALTNALEADGVNGKRLPRPASTQLLTLKTE